jgi:hypothetical protein
MVLVVLSGLVLFLICSEGGRLMIIFNLLIKPLIWVFTFPIVGPFIFVITGLVIYAVMVKTPSSEWKKNEKYVFYSLLLITAGGFLSSTEHSGFMFIMTCLVGVSYPIIQIVRFELKGVINITKLLK